MTHGARLSCVLPCMLGLRDSEQVRSGSFVPSFGTDRGHPSPPVGFDLAQCSHYTHAATSGVVSRGNRVGGATTGWPHMWRPSAGLLLGQSQGIDVEVNWAVVMMVLGQHQLIGHHGWKAEDAK